MSRLLGFAGKIHISAHLLVSRLYETIEFSSIIFPKLKSMLEIGLRHPTIYFVVLIYLYTEPTGVVY